MTGSSSVQSRPENFVRRGERRAVTGGLVAISALAMLATASCSRQDGETAAAEAVNLALSDMGGAVEELTGNYGPGFTGRRLVDGLLQPAWKVAVAWPDQEDIGYPQEAVFSFFERQPAMVRALTIVLPEDVSAAPKDIEISVTTGDLYGSYVKVASDTLEARPGEQTVSFAPVEARFVKLSMLSGVSPDALEIAEVRVLEGTADAYTPLFVREPASGRWKGSPRAAAQRGLDWLQHAGPVWIRQNGCFGCHVQAQVLMGQTVAYRHGYRVNMRSMQALFEHSREQSSWGTWWNPAASATAFGAMGVAHAIEVLGDEDDREYPYTDRGFQAETSRQLVGMQLEDGSLPVDEANPPIVQGRFMTTGNALVAIEMTADRTGDPAYTDAARRALAWIASNEPETTQDSIFKLIALMHYGTPEQKRTAWSVVETLAAEQQADGGWKENAESAGSNAIATGQVLYAFKQAGVSIHGDMFRRGVDFLLGHQINDPESLDNGSWAAMNTASERPSGYAHTMWAVIGLAGAYGEEPTGALQIVKRQGDKPPARNLVIVLDASGSMKTELGASTRWVTALEVLEQVVGELPEDLKVGLRVYGHRYSSRSAETCLDSELVVPVAKLDRAGILSAASTLQPRGETPLVYSVRQSLDDLRDTGGGSVILITDGEESCKGDMAATAEEMRASGLDVTLNIVGFTLENEAVEAELGTLADSTGGHYYGAGDGSELTRAILLAAMQRLPYDILDTSGSLLVSGQTSELSRELPPGEYRLRINALGQVLERPITIVANETTSLALGVEGDTFVLQ